MRVRQHEGRNHGGRGEWFVTPSRENGRKMGAFCSHRKGAKDAKVFPFLGVLRAFAVASFCSHRKGAKDAKVFSFLAFFAPSRLHHFVLTAKAQRALRFSLFLAFFAPSRFHHVILTVPSASSAFHQRHQRSILSSSPPRRKGREGFPFSWRSSRLRGCIIVSVTPVKTGARLRRRMEAGARSFHPGQEGGICSARLG